MSWLLSSVYRQYANELFNKSLTLTMLRKFLWRVFDNSWSKACRPTFNLVTFITENNIPTVKHGGGSIMLSVILGLMVATLDTDFWWTASSRQTYGLWIF